MWRNVWTSISGCVSVDVTAHDIAHMSLVLANHGADPEDQEELIEPQYAKAIRALMLTCGMYDGSGEFAMTVGFPAKSGVGGGIAVPLVDRMGNRRFLVRPLDEKGNSAIFNTITNKWTEELARAVTMSCGGSVSVSLYCMDGATMKRYRGQGHCDPQPEAGRGHPQGEEHQRQNAGGGVSGIRRRVPAV